MPPIEPSLIVLALVVLAVLQLVLLAVLLARSRAPADPAPLLEELARQGRADGQRLERELRDEVARSSSGTRQELARELGGTRQELAQTLATFQQTLLAQSGDVARTQNEQMDTFRAQLGALQQGLNAALLAGREAQDAALRRFGDTLGEQLRALSDANDKRLSEVRLTVEAKLTAIQGDNEKKLEQMRATVDEKLHATLEQRLGESFKQVAERLEQVHKGLGEMQTLARDVGSLNRVLTNVKTRGIFGEVQLAGLLEQVFTPDQYATNVETLVGTGARVEFAIRLPGRRDDGAPLWLPIDAKFPREDYERLLEAQERADPVAVEVAAKAIEMQLRKEARTIREKYVAPPHTTDFGILFVPTEGLYAEALRRPGLVESLQREHKVMLAGPTTLLATLSSLQMGFRTLALEKRSAEVWEVLGAVKTEFAKFGDVLAKTKKKLDEASNTIDQAAVRTRAMARQLKTVEALPEARAQQLLPGALDLEEAEPAPDA
ncbi:DNA recombination protein RmuC [Aquincola sp. MAHUQ-54]|uniref:DNA recombination protein RmuC n=1 Tax=Aquincola agrisoli TaxID=3119538 RepID=A0AAW9QBY5_9BURK